MGASPQATGASAAPRGRGRRLSALSALRALSLSPLARSSCWSPRGALQRAMCLESIPPLIPHTHPTLKHYAAHCLLVPSPPTLQPYQSRWVHRMLYRNGDARSRVCLMSACMTGSEATQAAIGNIRTANEGAGMCCDSGVSVPPPAQPAPHPSRSGGPRRLGTPTSEFSPLLGESAGSP